MAIIMVEHSGKAPAFQFYPNDWTHDMQEHSLEIRGAWITILCTLWWAATKGEATKQVNQWARILGVNEPECERILEYICSVNIADVTKCNGDVTVVSRRMVREFKARQDNKLRQQRHRKNTTCNADVTPPSSSSSSSSSSKTNISPLADPPKKSKIKFSFDARTWAGITDAKLAQWTEAFPAVDVAMELKRAALWVLDNPSKRKKQWGRFLTNWLGRTQEKGGNRGRSDQTGRSFAQESKIGTTVNNDA